MSTFISKGECMKSEGLTPAQLAERNAEYVTEISRLEKERAVLAAENAELKSVHPQPFGAEMMKALDAYEKHQDEVPETGMLNAFFILRDSIRVDTPATDAFLAEVRAQGVDMARNAMIDFVDGEVGPNKNVPGLIRGAEICVSIAEQLRKGGSQ
ncbi:TPA: hypothetical protein PBR63_003975 [Escherichia coli]|nr:hypothetical protein [Escherichia coli]HDP7110724.1 hypothetical protein [Escherichia coli]